jgi:hypothetical protein
MRVEVRCTKCKASVLVIDADPSAADKAKPDPADVVRKIKAAGWTLNKAGGVCTDH